MDIKSLKAKDVMVSRDKLITIAPNDKIALADLKMLRNNVGSLPVVDDDGKLLGIITQRDIMLSRFNIGDLEVKDLMARECITVDPETELKEVLKIMLENKIERVPVVSDNGKLEGLVVVNKILKALLKVME